jgi:hypothetical protein
MFSFALLNGADIRHSARCLRNFRRLKVLARTGKKRGRVAVKDMKFRNDPMVRFYEKTQDWLQERGRPIVMAAGIIVGLIVLYTAAHYFLDYRKSKAEAAFAQAFEKYNAPVQDTAPAIPTTKYYTDDKTKWQESAEAFEQLAREHSSSYGTLGRYYAGVSYLHVDRDKGVKMLQEVADKNDKPTSDLARLAIAEDALANGDAEKAISTYEKLLSTPSSLKSVVQLGLGRAYEKAGDTEKAAQAYFEVASFDRSSPAGSDAEKRLAALAPERIKDLPAPDLTKMTTP